MHLIGELKKQEVTSHTMLALCVLLLFGSYCLVAGFHRHFAKSRRPLFAKIDARDIEVTPFNEFAGDELQPYEYDEDDDFDEDFEFVPSMPQKKTERNE